MIRLAKEKDVLDAMLGKSEVVTDHSVQQIFFYMEYTAREGKCSENLMKLRTKVKK